MLKEGLKFFYLKFWSLVPILKIMENEQNCFKAFSSGSGFLNLLN